MTTWQDLYKQNISPGQAISADNKITQTKAQFLAKYANAIDANGKFIPGKANLYFDGENASDVYDKLIGAQTRQVQVGNGREGLTKSESYFNPEVNMDWADDTRSGGGWAALKDVVLPGIGITAAVLGGQALMGNGMPSFGGEGGLLGGGTTGTTGATLGNGGAYSSFVAPEALTSVPAITGEVGSLAGSGGLLGADAATSVMGSGTGLTATGFGTGGSSVAGMGGNGLLASSGTGGLGTSLASGGGGLASMGGGTGLTAGGVSAGTGSGLLSSVGSFLSDNPLITKIGGALLGAAASQDTTTNKDPWGPAAEYMKKNLQTNQNMMDYYMANPFSTEQKNAYQNSANVLANNNANVNPMMGMANSFMTSKGGNFTGMPAFTTGTTAAPIDWSKYANIGLPK